MVCIIVLSGLVISVNKDAAASGGSQVQGQAGQQNDFKISLGHISRDPVSS